MTGPLERGRGAAGGDPLPFGAGSATAGAADGDAGESAPTLVGKADTAAGDGDTTSTGDVNGAGGNTAGGRAPLPRRRRLRREPPNSASAGRGPRCAGEPCGPRPPNCPACPRCPDDWPNDPDDRPARESAVRTGSFSFFFRLRTVISPCVSLSCAAISAAVCSIGPISPSPSGSGLGSGSATGVICAPLPSSEIIRVRALGLRATSASARGFRGGAASGSPSVPRSPSASALLRASTSSSAVASSAARRTSAAERRSLSQRPQRAVLPPFSPR